MIDGRRDKAYRETSFCKWNLKRYGDVAIFFGFRVLLSKQGRKRVDRNIVLLYTVDCRLNVRMIRAGRAYELF